ncbi:MAG: SDR family NAD(P)-dependent oxidoreductase [Stellaceae bacterium]
MPTDVFSLAGKTAVVTGAGRGFGRAIAIGFAGRGANVVVGARTERELTATVAECLARGGKAAAVQTDITSRAACQRLVEHAVAAFGGVDIAFCNAATGLFGPAESISETDWNREMQVTIAGYFNIAQSVGRQMIKQRRGGSIIAMSANASIVGYAELTAGAAAKGAVDQMCRNLALEWGCHGIRVNSMNPGYTEHVPEYGDVSTGAGEDLEGGIRMMTPMGRRARIDELVWPAVFLASDASSFITGASLVVDGGYSIK